MDVDYERYAEGEAMLGWVNLDAEVSLQSDPEEWLLKISKEVPALSANGNEVGHFKMSLSGHGKRWRIHQVVSGEEVDLISEGTASQDETSTLQMLVNLRAEGDAQTLQGLVHAALVNQAEAQDTFHQEAAFQPGKPEPTHRVG